MSIRTASRFESPPPIETFEELEALIASDEAWRAPVTRSRDDKDASASLLPEAGELMGDEQPASTPPDTIARRSTARLS